MTFSPRDSTFTKFIPEWSICLGLIIYFVLIGDRAKPFLREFFINDPTIQHPFTQYEQVTNINCILISSLVPLISITLVNLHKSNFNLSRLLKNNSKFLNFQISILGLLLTLSITGCITNFLKNLIARPRPDFIARCKPDLLKIDPKKNLYTIEICTGDYELILEGLRSTPSGHSSIAFAGLNYLTLFLWGQWKVWDSGTRLHYLLLGSIPELIASFIALSRTQDYRHHFGDILMGSLIGIGLSWAVYRKLYRGLWDEDSDEVYYLRTEREILPLYNRD